MKIFAMLALIWSIAAPTPSPSPLRMILAHPTPRIIAHTDHDAIAEQSSLLKSPSESQNRSEGQKSRADGFWSLVLTFGQFFTSVVLALVAYFQYRTLRKQNELFKIQLNLQSNQLQLLQNQENAQIADERAWIQISKGNSRWAWNGKFAPPFQSVIINKGKTPARVTGITASYRVLSPAEFADLPAEPQYKSNKSTKLTLFPGAEFAATFQFDASVGSDAVTGIPKGTHIVYFQACVDYQDIFGKDRKTTVGFRYFSPGLYPPHGFQEAGPPAYNRAT